MSKLHYGLIAFVPLALTAQMQSVYAVNYMTVEEAQKGMFSGAKSFKENFLKFSKDDKKKIRSLSKISATNDEQKIWRVIDANGKQVGFFVLDYVYGKHEFITYAVAIDMNGVVISTDILEYKESYGGEVKDVKWRKQFVGKKLADKFTLDDDIQNISGATLSCKHIADGVKRVLAVYEIFLKN